MLVFIYESNAYTIYLLMKLDIFKEDYSIYPNNPIYISKLLTNYRPPIDTNNDNSTNTCKLTFEEETDTSTWKKHSRSSQTAIEDIV